MIRKNLADLTDEEFDNIVIPYEDNLNKYIQKYVLPNFLAFALASAFERNAMWESSLIQEYNSIKDKIFIINEDKDIVIKDIKEILEIKYSLLITNDKPLEIKKIVY